ncbi:hypothetical protein CC86DRAFT_409651 [Ophiobolus disseminans]|uniref:Uncharacterized protein n=1 Tax=Ophiobolus disseminans TaxID=1469910 RepID=A0A6A6ZRH5_9PLEO|nr:hypothetical protein CC86DRAFT_409651 [Ophiobolus disseminans]
MASRGTTKPSGSDLDQAHAELLRARYKEPDFTQTELNIDKELKQLEERKCWLNTLRKLNRGQHKDWVGRQAPAPFVHDHSIIPYCQAWNVRLAEEMQACLPVEMRNLVYYYLWDKATIIAYPDLMRVAGGTRCVDECATLALPHFVKLDFMGMTTARETVRALYDAFHLRGEHVLVRHPKHIETAVTKDVFGVGLDPGLHLKSLTVRIKLDKLRTARTPHILTKICRHTQSDKIYTQKDELKEWLKALLYIRHKAEFELRIDLFQRDVRLTVIEEVLIALMEILQAFETWNASVATKGFLDSDAEDVIKDVDDYYASPQGTWKMNIRQYLVQALDADLILDRHVHFFNEPSQHVSDRNFIHGMWDESENEYTTDEEDDDRSEDEESEEDEDSEYSSDSELGV